MMSWVTAKAQTFPRRAGFNQGIACARIFVTAKAEVSFPAQNPHTRASPGSPIGRLGKQNSTHARIA
jgi:hypothetical protein